MQCVHLDIHSSSSPDLSFAGLQRLLEPIAATMGFETGPFHCKANVQPYYHQHMCNVC